jgi:hypothetical protein
MNLHGWEEDQAKDDEDASKRARERQTSSHGGQAGQKNSSNQDRKNTDTQ